MKQFYRKHAYLTALMIMTTLIGFAQHPTPPMGFMSWNYFADAVNERELKEMADAMAANGMVAAGYTYICIDDGWQGGRDNRNNIIPDPVKFPSGIKALADYVHSKGMKLGIYSDAAQLTCGGYTASIDFEEQDAKTFASWGIDYLKYDYCNAPTDSTTARIRYSKMSDALRKSGREITFAVCEWGDRQPWLWAAKAGGQVWRIAADIRDKWKADNPDNQFLGSIGAGIADVVNIDADLGQYAGTGRWNDPDMLVVGLYGRKGPSGDLGGTGCQDEEYRSQMSLWCLLAAPLMVSCDVRQMNEATKKILLNKDIIEIDQDPLGLQAIRKVKNEDWSVFVKTLSNGDFAIGILNLSKDSKKFSIGLNELGLTGKFNSYDLWSKARKKNIQKLEFDVASHETMVIRLTK